MDFNDAVNMATCTEGKIDSVIANKDLLINLMESLVANGEILDQVKKHTFYNREIPYHKTQEYLDVMTTRTERLDEILVDSSVTSNKEFIELDTRLFHSAIGVVTEGVELLQNLLNSIKNETPIDKVNFREELFDVMWYVLIAHDAINESPIKTLQIGFEKLKHRYPDKFNSYSANHRDLVGERLILES